MQELQDGGASGSMSPALSGAEKNAHLTFLGEFTTKTDEAIYRQYVLKSDNHRTVILVLIVLGATLLFAVSDYQLFGLTAKLVPLLSVRMALIISSVILLFTLRKNCQPRLADVLLLGYTLLMVAVSIYVSSTRPPAYTTHALLALLVVCLIYLDFPLPLKFQLIPAVLASVGEIILLVAVNPASDSLSNTAIIFCFSCANVTGALASRQVHGWKRRQFIALLQETQLRKDLELAIAEIRTLRGIIPICSYCKRIRQEIDTWEQIEEYVIMHTHAQFSHGICPECAEKHWYGRLRDRQGKT